MRTCFVVPGLLGSELFTNPQPGPTTPKLWVNLARLALGDFPELALAPNGIDPQPPQGRVCQPGLPLSEFYGTLAETLLTALGPEGYQVRRWGYDWRKAIFPQGQLLAAQILQETTPADPCSIVAHSQGGLVARCAWAILFASGKSNLVRRIVTLGTPHRGSYAPAMVWSLDEELLLGLGVLVNTLAGFVDPSGFALPHPYTRQIELSQVTATWPAFYELLPIVDSLSAIADPLRAQLFDLANWPASRQLSSSHLLRSLHTWQAFLKNSISVPPPHVLTTVGGTGRTTPWELAQVDELGNPEAIRTTSSGDGRVALDSSLLLPGWAAVYPCGHSDLTLFPGLLADLPGMVLVERGPGPAPAVPQEKLDNGMAITNGPPIFAIGGGGAVIDCRDGKCSC